jgi:hypothetical protein
MPRSQIWSDKVQSANVTARLSGTIAATLRWAAASGPHGLARGVLQTAGLLSMDARRCAGTCIAELDGMTTSISMVPVRCGRACARGAVWRAGVCAGLLVLGAPALAAGGQRQVPSTGPTAPTNHDPIPTVPGSPLPTQQPSVPQVPNPTDLQVPDEATARELEGQYGIGLGLLVLIGVLVAGAVIGLASLLLRRSWSSTKS